MAVPIVNESSEILPHEFRLGADILLAVFFVFSGFLITASLERSQNLVRFATARILRIYPALISVSLGLLFVLGPLVTALPLYLKVIQLPTMLICRSGLCATKS
jgi:peptidoglycan/LPS O-acetylase OafA/YrhL